MRTIRGMDLAAPSQAKWPASARVWPHRQLAPLSRGLRNASDPIVNVVAGNRQGVYPLRELHLEDAETRQTERYFATLEVELPHAAEAFVVKGRRFGATGLEAIVPGGERPCVMQPPVLQVS